MISDFPPEKSLSSSIYPQPICYHYQQYRGFMNEMLFLHHIRSTRLKAAESAHSKTELHIAH